MTQQQNSDDKNFPLVSVIIPSYNHAQYIETAIDSVLNQTYPNIELIVVDDGSSDNSREVIKLLGQTRNFTAILNEQNRGQSAVINQALQVCSGTYVSFLPSDDWYLPRKTELQVEKFESSSENVGVVYGKGQRFFEDTNETHNVSLPVFTGQVAEKFITSGQFVYPATPMFRKECFHKVPLDETLKAEGEAVYIRLALKYEFEFVDEYVAVMRDHSYNIGKDADIMYDEVRKYWESFFARDDIPSYLKALKPVRMTRLYKTKGLQFLFDKQNFGKARDCFRNAIQTDWRNIFDMKILAGLSIASLPEKISVQIVTWRKDRNR